MRVTWEPVVILGAVVVIALALRRLSSGLVFAPLEPIPAPEDVAAPPEHALDHGRGLRSVVLRPGDEVAGHPSARSVVTVHYTGWTTDGQMFDSSVARGRPATFPLGGVIEGWRLGVPLMVPGEQRRFWIPAALAYEGGAGPQGTLVFDVELLAIAR